MKIILIALVVLSVMSDVSAQLRDSTRHFPAPDLLLKKSKKQQTAAWFLLGGGVILSITGTTIIANEAAAEVTNGLTYVLTLGYVTPQPVKHHAAGPVLLIAGTGSMLGSIPLFIASGRNKHQAKLSIGNKNVFIMPDAVINQSALTLKIPL